VTLTGRRKAREYRLTVCRVCGLEAPFECEHMRAAKTGAANVYVSIKVVPESQLAGAVEALGRIGALARNEHVGAIHALQNIARLVDEALGAQS
jgi:hypothetical protein